jgi:hypothetical protein
MVKLVIWTDLNAQSVCMYQIWIFLILWCSTSWEESRDYKFVIFGSTEQKIWIYQANRRFDSNLKIVSNWTHKIWSFIVLRDSRSLKDSNETLFVIFWVTDQKLWFFKDLESNLNSNCNSSFCFNQSRPRGAFLLVRTGSAGSGISAAGSYDASMVQIIP